MAKQKGAFPMQGTLGNVTFFKSQDGFLVKQKSAVSKDKIMSSQSLSVREKTCPNLAGQAKPVSIYVHRLSHCSSYPQTTG